MSDTNQLTINGLIFSDEFDTWLDAIPEIRGRYHILHRISRAKYNYFDDSTPIGDGLFIMKLYTAYTYRIYYARINGKVYWLLNGAHRAMNPEDIQQAKTILKQLQAQETTKPVNLVKYINSRRVMENYLKRCFLGPISDIFVFGLNNAVRAVGVDDIAKIIGMSAQQMLDDLDQATPVPYFTVHKILRALGGYFTVFHHSYSRKKNRISDNPQPEDNTETDAS